MKKITRIKRLEMKGFKSFAKKTDVPFGDSLNCILGPNGAGKSNIGDAICFVLGKSSAKGMRAEKSANLIYNGGKTKKPAKEGWVSIVFDNKSKVFGNYGDEVIISRSVKQNGASTYKLNNKSVSRQQILDVLAKAKINPDGYNIILQGDIVRLIEMTPTERRGILEEIAGISMYEDKKKKAMNELEKVENSLKEAEIILAEREVYLKELGKERKQALKFKELNENIKRNKKTLIVNRINEKNTAITDLSRKIEANNKLIDSLREKIASYDKKILTLNSKIDKINKEIETKGEKEQIDIHKSVEILRVELAVKRQRLETAKQEIEKVKQRIAGLKKTKQELESKIKITRKEYSDAESSMKNKKKELALIEKKIVDFRKKHNIENASKIDEQIHLIDKEAEKIQESIAKLRENQQSLLREKDKYEILLEQVDEKMANLLSVQKENKKMLEELKQKKDEFKRASKELTQAVNEDASFAAQLSNARTKLSSKMKEQSLLNAQNSVIKEGIAGGIAVKKILDMKKQGVYGTIANLGVVSSKYALALETAAGSRMTSIVVDNDKTAAECINFLKKNKYGIATFIPLTKIKSPEKKTVPEGKGVHGTASSLVKYDAKYKKAFDYVFGSTIVVDDIETARRIGIGSVRMVTLTGDLVERSGAMQGGFRSRNRKVGFRQKDVDDKLEKIEKEIADLQKLLSSIEIKRKNNEQLIDRLRVHKANLEADIIKLEKTLHIDSESVNVSRKDKDRYAKEIAGLDKQIDSVNKNISDFTLQIASLKTKKQKLRDSLTSMRNPVILAQMNSFEEKKQELQSEINKRETSISISSSQINNILNPELENISKIFKQHEKELTSFKKEKESLTIKIRNEERELKKKEELEKRFFSAFKGLFNERTKYADNLKDIENNKSNSLVKISELEGKNNNFSLEVAKLKGELAGIKEEEKEFTNVEPFKNKDESIIQREIKQFEKLAEDLGVVNMKALEIYDTVMNEFKSLEKKRSKLSKEKDDILFMVNKIETKKKELFLKTFDIMNNNFQKFFTAIVNKGQASLVLENPKEPFEGGLTIKVRLTGKKFLDIRGLSGGEKTLTALAFLFAVQEYEPAQFYYLDEIDAALDKHNSERLAKLIRSYCDIAQYIIISHNDAVLSEADNLFGISMGKDGVSKITSIKL